MTAQGGASPDLGVVVVTWNSARTLPALIDGLRTQTGELTLEIVFVDNASQDDTVSVIRGLAPEAQLIANDVNRGLAAANNQGILGTRAPLVAICNPDIVPAPDALVQLCSAIERNPSAGIAVPLLRRPGGGRHVSVGGVPSVAQALLGRRLGLLLSRRRGTTQADLWWDDWPHDTEGPVPRGAEACYVVRRTAIAEVGLQDERFPLDWEGIDWAARFASAGWKVWFVPSAVVEHEGGASIRQAQLRWIVRSHRGMYSYCADRVPRAARPAVAVVVALRAALKGMSLAVGHNAYEQAQATLDGR
jgi:GT2 family glycosyltransferase